LSHPGSVDIIDFLLLTIYPIIALIIIEFSARGLKISSWKKLTAQGVAMIGFAIFYTAFITMITSQSETVHSDPHWLTSFVLLALAIALFYQARRSKFDPTKSDY